jgi:HD superfamily phosphohydrolase YqeK
MSVVAWTDADPIAAAASGALPPWAEVRPGRRAHLVRVAGLLEAWARASGRPEEEIRRWRAAGILHDALRDADPDHLRPWVEPRFLHWPPALWHGPATAARLGEAVDADVRQAIAYHSVGAGDLGELGRALYLADFLDPARAWGRQWRAALLARLPSELGAVLEEVVAARLGHQLRQGWPLLPEAVAFWNRCVR